MAPSRSELLVRYGTASVPRYTSYPSANHWKPLPEDELGRIYARAGSRPVSLYVHVPFCHKLCFYCACNMEVTHNLDKVERYLRAVDAELARVAALLPKRAPLIQVHLGGGTPTFLDEAQLERLMSSIRRRFNWPNGIEASIEVHPPITTFGQVDTLARLGFNRISMGVQDFDPEVQQIVNRPQSFEQTSGLVKHARARGFVSVNIDLMYGLPLQTAQRFGATLDRIEEMRPDRIALFGYAHMPEINANQRVLDATHLPNASERLAILESAIARLTAIGYCYIGLDHFALADDELSRARADGTLRRNFMGYTTCAESDVLAFGPSSISEIDGAFVQNEREATPYCARIEQGRLPGIRGMFLTADDLLRKRLVHSLFCHLEVDTRSLGVPFEQYFAPERPQLEALLGDGLIERAGSLLKVTPEGQLFLRNIAAAFDPYLAKSGPRRHSVAL